ncbi:ABC transporter permease [Massilia terrae]|uniref:ABC transporter permease n=1 Tax=Massilia terrae TaxID=1811224 RepID=A0ABT2CSN7_9BURK|nr:ABC transporter permease [Massilia terrae]MCS0656998.1 ABC transporter permease [Massilia terrae]
MKLRDFRIGWRLLARQPGYSAVIVLGLAVGFAACFLLLALVRYAFTYNDAIPDAGRIWLVKERANVLPRPDWQPIATRDLARTVRDSGLPVSATTAKSYDVAAQLDSRLVPLTVQVADGDYLGFFGIRALEGDTAAALARPDGIALSRETATRLFGDPHALGKVVRIAGQPYEVRAVLPDLPANTSVDIDALVGAGQHSFAGGAPNIWTRATVYVKTAPDFEPGALQAVLQEAINQRDAALPLRLRQLAKGGPVSSIGLARLSDLYFDPDLLASRSGRRYGSRSGVLGLAALAVLILALATANYVNLAAIRTAARRREIGMRKALGVSPGALARQFMAESLVVSMAATVIGLALAWLVLPLFSTLVNRPLAAMMSTQACLLMLATGAATGMLAGLYPYVLARRLPASVALQGRGNGETAAGARLRRVLSVLQFGVAIALIAATLAVGWQTRYASQADPGFDPAHLLVVAAPGGGTAPAAQAFRDDLARLPGVAGVTVSDEAIGRDGMKSTVAIERPGQAPVQLEFKAVGANFFKVYGVRPLLGRLFDESLDRSGADNVVLNARAAQALGYDSPEAAVGQVFGKNSRIVGIVPELRFQTMKQQPGPIMFRVREELNVFTVRAAGDLAAVRNAIESAWTRHFPNDPPDIESAASIFAQNYDEDLRLAKILGLASIVATTLASFGIYVLAAYSVERRSREIVLRKLHGARGRDISRLVGREFGVLVALGTLAGLPLAWLGIERYLAGFVERAPMGQMPLVLAFALIAAVGIAATTRQTLRAARMSPALALKD